MAISNTSENPSGSTDCKPKHKVDSYSKRPVECEHASVIDQSEPKLLTSSTSTGCQSESEYPKESNECHSSPDEIKNEEWLENIAGEHQTTSDFESGELLNPLSEPLHPLSTETDNPQIMTDQHATSKGQSIPTCESKYPPTVGPNKTDNIPVNAQFSRSTGTSDPTLTDRSNEYSGTDNRGLTTEELNGSKDHTMGGSDRDEDPTTGGLKGGGDSTTCHIK